MCKHPNQSHLIKKAYLTSQIREHVSYVKPSLAQLNMHFPGATGAAITAKETEETSVTKNRTRAFFMIRYPMKVIKKILPTNC
jgi:hypothetical protein